MLKIGRKKSTAKKSGKDRVADPTSMKKFSVVDISMPINKEQCRGHIRKESNGSVLSGPDVTWSISTGQSSDLSSSVENLLVSSSATTHLRRNMHVNKDDEHISTNSEPLVRLAPPSAAPSIGRLRLMAELQLAQQKAEQMRIAIGPGPDVPVALSNKSNGGDISRQTMHQWRSNQLDDNSSLVTESALQVDLNCDVYAADDIIQASVSVFTCGILSNYRPLLEDEASIVTDCVDCAISSGGSYQSLRYQTSKSTCTVNKTSGRGGGQTNNVVAQNCHKKPVAKLLDDEKENVVVGKYGHYVLI